MDVSFILQTSAPFLTFSLMISLISKHPSARYSSLSYEENIEHLKELAHDTCITKFEPSADDVFSLLKHCTAICLYEEEFEGKKPPPTVENNGLRFSLKTMAPTGYNGLARALFSLKEYALIERVREREEEQSIALDYF